MTKRHLSLYLLSCVTLLSACDRKTAQEEVQAEQSEATETATLETPTSEPVKPTIQLTISLGQALRCTRIAEFAGRHPEALGTLSPDEARSIALKAKNAAFTEGAKQDLTPRQIEDQENAVYLGYEGIVSANVSAFGPPPSDEARRVNAERLRERIAKITPDLSAELTEICAPLFI